MSGYKVEICGVNTAKLPLLTTEEKEELFKRILAGDKQAREDLYQRKSASCVKRHPALLRK